MLLILSFKMLYILLSLHQTTTKRYDSKTKTGLYILLSLHQTTTPSTVVSSIILLYILLSLHQTTTRLFCWRCSCCCIFFYLYIKPQLSDFRRKLMLGCIFFYLYIKPQQNYREKLQNYSCIFFYLYIKPQQKLQREKLQRSCIFFYLYIKPQHICRIAVNTLVVYSSIFTSNHNVNIEIYSLPMNYISILFYEVAFMAFLRGKYTKKILIVSVL